MDQKTENAMLGRLSWMIAAWYLFVLWSWSVPLYARNEELFAVSLVIMVSGIVLAVVSFARFLYELRKSAQRQIPLDNDFVIRVLIDLGALTVLSRFSVTMNRVAEGFDNDAVLLLVSGIILLTLAYGLVRVIIGISPVRAYFAARWRAVVVVVLALALAGAWHDVARALQVAAASLGVAGAANDLPRQAALHKLWHEGYVFSLALLAVFVVMLAAAWRQFGLIGADMARLAARFKAAQGKLPPPRKPRAEGPGGKAEAAAPARPARSAKSRRLKDTAPGL